MGAERAPSLGDDAAVRRMDTCALSMVRRIAAMLDLDPDPFADGMPLPRGWHFFLLGGDTRKSQLRQDGFPGFGLPMPDLGLPRLLLGGRSVVYHSDIRIGASIERLSRFARLERRDGPAGPSAIVTLEHTLRALTEARPAIVETQTYVLLPMGKPAQTQDPPADIPPAQMTVTPDDSLLFMYSALGFNSHKIHLDRTYAREVERLPDLVVNGGLVTLLATEFLRNNLGIRPKTLKTRHTASLYCGRAIALDARRDGEAVTLTARDDTGVPAMTMVVEAA